MRLEEEEEKRRLELSLWNLIHIDDPPYNLRRYNYPYSLSDRIPYKDQNFADIYNNPAYWWCLNDYYRNQIANGHRGYNDLNGLNDANIDVPNHRGYLVEVYNYVVNYQVSI